MTLFKLRNQVLVVVIQPTWTYFTKFLIDGRLSRADLPAIDYAEGIAGGRRDKPSLSQEFLIK